MSKKALVPVNLLNSAGNPAGPTFQAGDLYYDTTLQSVYVYNGTTWGNVAAGISDVALRAKIMTVLNQEFLHADHVGVSVSYDSGKDEMIINDNGALVLALAGL